MEYGKSPTITVLDTETHSHIGFLPLLNSGFQALKTYFMICVMVRYGCDSHETITVRGLRVVKNRMKKAGDSPWTDIGGNDF